MNGCKSEPRPTDRCLNDHSKNVQKDTQMAERRFCFIMTVWGTMGELCETRF